MVAFRRRVLYGKKRDKMSGGAKGLKEPREECALFGVIRGGGGYHCINGEYEERDAHESRADEVVGQIAWEGSPTYA